MSFVITEYDIVVTAIERLSTEQLTFSFVKTRLLDEEAKRQNLKSKAKNQVEPSTAFSVPTRRGSSSNIPSINATSNTNKRSYRCHNCGLLGHFRRDCKKPQGWQKKNQNTRRANIATDLGTRKQENRNIVFLPLLEAIVIA